MVIKISKLICISSILTTFFLQSASATLIRSIDAEGADVFIDADHHLHDNGFVYPVDIKGVPKCPWISPTQAYQGYGAIGFQYPARSANVGNTQKVGYQITQPGGPGGVDFGQDQYTGFALKLGSGNLGKDFNVPSDWLLLAQYHQGSPHSPPLSLQIQPNSGSGNTVKYVVFAINDDTAYKNPANGSFWSGLRMQHTTKIFEGTMKRGQYYRFILKTNFQPVGASQTGAVSLWVNGSPVKVFGQNTTQYEGYIAVLNDL